MHDSQEDQPGDARAAAASAQPHAPVPEDVYASWSPAPAPDGQAVAFVSDRGGEPQVWIRRRSQPTERVATAPERVVAVSWSPDGVWLGCVTATREASRHQVWVLRPDGRGLRLVGGARSTTAVCGSGPRQGWSADGRLLLTETDETSVALLVDPATGYRQPLVTGQLITLLDVSADGRRAVLRRGPRGQRHLVVVDLETGQLHRLDTGTGGGSADQGCFSADGSLIYARSDIGHEHTALVAAAVDGSSGPSLLAARKGADLHDCVLAPDGRTAALVWNVLGGVSALSVLDLDTRREHDVGPLPRDVVDECRFQPDGTGLVLTAEGWSDPRGVWLLDLAGQNATPVSSRGSSTLRSSLGATTPSIDTTVLTGPELHHLRSADGLGLSGWLYRPEGQGPWPTVIHLHGGPEAQERPVYNSLFQSLVAAGLAVFAPNVRGSSGFGRAFGCADDREGRYAAIADVAACANYLLTAGIAQAGRIGCAGRSYGGYLTLAAMVRYPEMFAAGVDICGIANFATFYAHTEPWIAAAAASKYGDPVVDAALLHDLSPIHRIDRLSAPLLVVHGAHDTNVPLEESEQVVAALAARGTPHRYLLFEDEAHELLQTDNRVTFVQATVAWLAHHLLNRSNGSSARPPTDPSSSNEQKPVRPKNARLPS